MNKNVLVFSVAFLVGLGISFATAQPVVPGGGATSGTAISPSSVTTSSVDAGTVLSQSCTVMSGSSESVLALTGGSGGAFRGIAFNANTCGSIASPYIAYNTGSQILTISGGAGGLSLAGTISTGNNVNSGGAFVSSNGNSSNFVMSGSNGQFKIGSSVVWQNTAPTVTFCTSASVLAAPVGTAAFEIDVGTSCTGISTATVTLPTATTGWVCNCLAETSAATSVIGQTGGSTTTCLLTNYSRTTGLAQDWTANDDIRCTATAY